MTPKDIYIMGRAEYLADHEGYSLTEACKIAEKEWDKRMTKWCITTQWCKEAEVEYLGWQKPAWDENGYFWTNKETFRNIIPIYNSSEHPFLFSSKSEAIRYLKTLHIPQKCKIVKWF